MRSVNSPQGGGRVWYPVALASLRRSGPGSSGPGGAPLAMNDLAHWTPVCYASGGDATGYPRPQVTHHCPAALGESIPEQRSAGGIFV
jgi:hypothetical protein